MRRQLRSVVVTAGTVTEPTGGVVSIVEHAASTSAVKLPTLPARSRGATREHHFPSEGAVYVRRVEAKFVCRRVQVLVAFWRTSTSNPLMPAPPWPSAPSHS